MWDDISGSVGFSKVDGLMKFSLTRTGPTGRRVTVNEYTTEYELADFPSEYSRILDDLTERLEQAVV